MVTEKRKEQPRKLKEEKEKKRSRNFKRSCALQVLVERSVSIWRQEETKHEMKES